MTQEETDTHDNSSRKRLELEVGRCYNISSSPFSSDVRSGRYEGYADKGRQHIFSLELTTGSIYYILFKDSHISNEEGIVTCYPSQIENTITIFPREFVAGGPLMEDEVETAEFFSRMLREVGVEI